MLDIFIIISFLAVTLILGIYYSRNIKTMREYSIGDRRYNTPILVATLFATLIGGGSTLGIAEKVYSIGLVFAITCLGPIINKLLTALYIAPRATVFQNMISAGDIAEHYYGKAAKVITGLAGTAFMIGSLGVQVGSIGYISHVFLDISYEWGVFIGATIIVIYSSFGGVKAVTATDVIQFIILIIAIPLACYIGIVKVGGFKNLFSSLPHSHTSFSSNPQISLKYLCFLLFNIVPYLTPPFIQRLLMAKNPKQIAKSMYYTIAVCIPFYFMICLIGFIALKLFPDSNSSLAFPSLIKTVLPIGFKGIVIAGIFAAIMSTADSVLNCIGITVTHDIIQVLKEKPLSDKLELSVTRWITFLIGSIAIAVAIKYKDIFDLVINSLSIWASTVLMPILLGILGLRVSSNTFLISVFGGLFTLILWNWSLKQSIGIDGLLPSMITNTLILFTGYYFEKIFTYNRTEGEPVNIK